MTDAPSPLATPEAWDLVSPGYVSDIVPEFEPFALDALRVADVRPGEEIVDIACGPGTLSLLAARAGARVDALDFSTVMIDALRERATHGGITGVSAVVGDGMALPYADASFDAAFSMFGLIFFPDRARGFSEVARVLRPGGRCVVASWQPVDRVPLMAELFAAMREALAGLPAQGKAPLGEPDEVIAEMSAAGLVDAQVHVVAHVNRSESLSAWWASMRRSLAPLVLMRARMGEEPFRRLTDAVYARLERTFGDGPVEFTMTANFGFARRA